MVRAKRWASYNGDFPKRRKGGRWLCRWCDRPCSGRRENFCSADCQVEVAVRTVPRALRHYTYIRDRGICADCDGDMLWLRDELDALRKTDREAWLDQLACLGFTHKEGLKTLWQVDHTEPVAITGPVGLDAVETRCVRCHKRKTIGDLVTTRHVKKPKKKVRGKIRKLPKVNAQALAGDGPPKPTKFREKGLWLSAVSVRVEEVRKAHKAPCIGCGVKPEERRLKVTKGAGRAGVTELYCMNCGAQFLARMRDESFRATMFLLKGATDDGGAIRVADTMFEVVKARHRERMAERQRKKAEREAATTG